LREDRRHIRDQDVRELRTRLRTRLDLEMAATPEIIRIAVRTKPDLVTLVPERRRELTTEGGLDVVAQRRRLSIVIRSFHRAGIPVSLFVDPVGAQIRASHAVGADVIELHTGEYADATTPARRRHQLERLRHAASIGGGLGLHVHAGHGLNYDNTRAVVRIPELEEVSIGFAVIARGMEVGLYRAVKEMVEVVRTARR
jgi:pyridoxine 5-phosphate synthase